MATQSGLFQGLEGKVTEEQWETFLELQKQSGSLVCHDDDDFDEDDDDDNDSLDSELDIELDMSKVDIASHLPEEADVASSSKDDELLKRDQELTTKYLNGELTFTQFTTLAENNDEQGEAEDQQEDDEDMDAYGLEMEFEKKRKGMKRPRKRLGQLPRDLEGLMGEANLCFARGDREEAIKMCMELIRLAPTAAEPFQTLGMIYEESGDMEKSLQFNLIAAHLSPNDPEEWVKLAELSQELGDTKQAITCYTKGLKYDPENVSIHWERCVLFEHLNEKRKALEGYHQIIKIMKPDQGQQCLQLAREVAKTYHELEETKQAITVMEFVFEKHQRIITSEDVNMLLELQLTQNLYANVVKVLQKHCGVTLVATESKEFPDGDLTLEDKIKLSSECSIPDNLPIDLRIKLIVSLLHLGGAHLVDDLLAFLLEESLEEVGDLYLDVAEAYMDIGMYTKALPLLASLTITKNYNLAAIWLRYAECLNSLGNIEKAATAYQRVVEQAPSHMEARMSLSSVLQQLGRKDEALRAVTQDDMGDNQQNIQLLYQRCMLLYSHEKYEEFVHVANILLTFCMPKDLLPEESNAILNNLSQRRRLEAFRDVQKVKRLECWAPSISETDIPVDDMWDLYKKTCNKLFDLKQFSDLQDLTISALASPLLIKGKTVEKEAEFMCLLACYFNKNSRDAYPFIRELVVKDIDNYRLWNLFCQIVSTGQDIRHNKFCLRLTFKHPDHIVLGVLNGNNAMVAGSYKHALGEYMMAHKALPNDPFLSLMIGLTFTNMASQKFTAKKHTLVVQAHSFLNQYLESRGHCQETYYNIGRALHQLGLTFMSIHYYKKALALPPAVNQTEEDAEIFDLKYEIAFNLSLIYQASGSDNLASYYISKYCII